MSDLIEPIHAALDERYGDRVEDDELRALAQEAVDRYRSATVTNYLPILAHRYAMRQAAAADPAEQRGDQS